MRSILESLYNGNLSVNDRTYKRGTPYAKALNQMTEIEDKLLKSLPEEEHQLFMAYTEAAHALMSAAALEDFITGYRMGTRFILAALDNDSCFTPIGE